MEQGLHQRLKRWDCPSPQQLVEYQQRRASPEVALAIELHLAECVRCTTELTDLREFMIADLPVEESPPAPMPDRGSPWGALFAQLQPQRPAVALRGAGPSALVATAGETTIFLDVQPIAGGQLALQGQVVDADQDRWVGALVEIRQAGALVATAEVDDLGGFACPTLPPGSSELRVAPRTGRMIVLTEIDLRGGG